MAVVELRQCLIVLMIVYFFAVAFGLLASAPMVAHVYPQSECMLFASAAGQGGDKLSYGHYASECNRCIFIC